MTTGISITINIPGIGDAAATASVGGITLDTGGTPPPPEIDDATAADTIAESDAPPPAEFAGTDIGADAGTEDPMAPSPPADDGIAGSPIGDEEPPPPGDVSGDLSEGDFVSDEGGEPPPPDEDIPEAKPATAAKPAKGKRARRK